MNGSCPMLALDVVADDVAPSSVGISLAGFPFGASDVVAWELERFQYVLGEGPGADFAGGNGGVHLDDLHSTQVWAQLHEDLLRPANAAVFFGSLTIHPHQTFRALTRYPRQTRHPTHQ